MKIADREAKALVAVIALFIATCWFMFMHMEQAHAVSCGSYVMTVNDDWGAEDGATLHFTFQQKLYYQHCTDPTHHYDVLDYLTLKITSDGDYFCGSIERMKLDPGVLDGGDISSTTWYCGTASRVYNATKDLNGRVVSGNATDRCLGFHWYLYNDGFLGNDYDGSSPTGCLG